MATGLAIMGFGGGAFLAGYLNVYFMAQLGVARTMIALGVAYCVIMLIGASILRKPPEGWKPAGWEPAAMNVLGQGLTRNEALRTVQFYLLWAILSINVTAGIGILAQASPMMQDLFRKTPLEAAAVVSLISLFNAGGRLFWASLSGFHRAAEYLYAVFCGAVHAIPADTTAGGGARWGWFRDQFADRLHYVWRGLRYHSSVLGGSVRSTLCGGDSRGDLDGVERGSGGGSGDHYGTLESSQGSASAGGEPDSHLRSASGGAGRSARGGLCVDAYGAAFEEFP